MERGHQSHDDKHISTESESVRYLREAIVGGKHWYPALLESIALWTVSEENYKDRQYRYLIGGEAFDLLLLAERLLAEVSSLVPEEEVVELLFHARPPIEISDDEFRRLIGVQKYHAQLNYFYGITVEEAILLAVEGDVRKEQFARGIIDGENLADEVHERVYGASRKALLSQFRRETGYSDNHSMQFYELKEFTYWLFKFRVNHSDKARMASDTTKGLRELERQRSKMGRNHHE
jgi:hypothetical protein